MARKRKAWSLSIEESGITVRVYERAAGGVLYRELRLEDGAKDRKSLGHRDRVLAESQASTLARRLAELRLSGTMGPIGLGQLARLYFHHRGPLLSATRQAEARSIFALLLRHLGDAFRVEDLGQTQVDTYCAARRAGTLRNPKRRGHASEGVKDGTLRHELLWLSSVLRWGRTFKLEGRRLLTVHPLEGVKLPREKNPRRPVASEERYRRAMAKADEADPHGRFRCILALARYTGRRVRAIALLSASDLHLTRDQVSRAIARAGLDERQADHMPNGAILWRKENDKLGFEELTALATAARRALDEYLRRRPIIGDAPLFPKVRDATRPAGKDMASHWMRRAEQLAGLTKLDGGLWHPYRRLWSVERKHLPDVDVAKAGGWRDVATMKKSYQLEDAATLLRVVENEPDSTAAGLTLDTGSQASRGGASS